jgi:hypothetical protein
VIDGLRAGIGDDGMPRGDLGARLSGFPSFEPDASRRLVVRARRRPLIELRTELARLLEMVDYALVNGLWIAMTGR